MRVEPLVICFGVIATLVAGEAPPTVAARLYWLTRTNAGQNAIYAVDSAERTPERLVAGGVTSFDLSARRSKIYWTDRDHIVAADLEGSAMTTVLAGLDEPDQIVVDDASNSMFWVEAGSRIRRAALDGTDPQTLLERRRNPHRLTIDHRENVLYFAEVSGVQLDWSLVGLDLADGTSELVATGLDWLAAIVLDRDPHNVGSAYSVAGDGSSSTLRRVALASSDTVDLFGTNGFIMTVLPDIDHERLFWAVGHDGDSVLKVSPPGGSPALDIATIDGDVWVMRLLFEPVSLELDFVRLSTSRSEVTLAWRTATDPGEHRFNVYRAEAGELVYFKVNDALILPEGVRRSFRFVDGTVSSEQTYHYRLEAIDRADHVQWIDLGSIRVAGGADAVLHQNQPNPFHPTTTITFDLPFDGPVSLRIFDVRGRMVRTLVNAPLGRDRYTVEWDGRDDRGDPVPNGVYFSRLEAGALERTRKLMLLAGN